MRALFVNKFVLFHFVSLNRSTVVFCMYSLLFSVRFYVVFFTLLYLGDPGIYNSSNRPVLGPPAVPKIEGGPSDACSRQNWLPHMHMHRKICLIFFLFYSFIEFFELCTFSNEFSLQIRCVCVFRSSESAASDNKSTEHKFRYATRRTTATQQSEPVLSGDGAECRSRTARHGGDQPKFK